MVIDYRMTPRQVLTSEDRNKLRFIRDGFGIVLNELEIEIDRKTDEQYRSGQIRRIANT